MMQKKNFLTNKKVLVFGLGLLGGGVATTNWLLKQGAKVTITDLKTKKQLAPSLAKLKGKVALRLGGHSKKDVLVNDIVVVNPDVSFRNPFVEVARSKHTGVENEATIFYKLWPGPIVAITGTRGKTTTTSWISHFINGLYPSIATGNSYKEPFLQALNKSNQFGVAVAELPSYHLEFFDIPLKAPRVAIITNISQDHLNRYRSLKDYAHVKGNIFHNQRKSHFLVLNADNSWTPFFVSLRPNSRIFYFSQEKLPKTKNGVYLSGSAIYFQKDEKSHKALMLKDFAARWGEHNVANLMAASLSAHLFGIPWEVVQKKINSLPAIDFRQQVIYKDKKLAIINDTTATSPDGGLAAVRRFASPATILITGGTDRKLDFKEWTKCLRKHIKPENIIFLAGSATEKMRRILGSFVKKSVMFDTLHECFRAAIAKTGKYNKSVILFSPASKSFEKFQNEFDRGRQFNALVRKEMRK